MVKYHTDSERGNPLSPHGLLFPINSKSSFICTIPQTGLHIPRPLLHGVTVCMYVYLYACMCVCLHVCVCARVRVCIVSDYIYVLFVNGV